MFNFKLKVNRYFYRTHMIPIMKKTALVFTVLSLMSFTGLSAQEKGFYLVADGSYGFYGQSGYDSNGRDFVQIRTSGDVKWQEPYKKNSECGFSLGTGFMFGDKGNGARYAIELGIGIGANKTTYNYCMDDNYPYLDEPDNIYYPYLDHRNSNQQEHFNNDNGYNTRAKLLSAHISFVRRMNLGEGFFLEPRLTAGFDYAARAHYGVHYGDGYHWFGTFNTRMYKVSFTPFVLERRFNKNRHFAVKAELGSITYMHCETEWVKEAYQIFDVNFNKFTAGLVYYFSK